MVAYYSESGGHGERLPASVFNLPLRVRYQSAVSSRFEVELSDGIRWVDAKDVVLAQGSAPPSKTR